ncbi:MAG: phosphoglycerate mutase family protein [Patescibacteria group bacterium]
MEKNKKTKLWFIRHAQSKTNASEDHRANNLHLSLAPLSEFGLKQSNDIVNYFDRAPDLIITSSYIRTKQTAGHLIKKYPHAPQEEWEIHEFTYISPNKCFNTTLRERKPLVSEYWNKNDPLYRDGNGAESFNDFIGRVRSVIEKLKSRKEKFIVLFGHEYVISAVKYLLEKNPEEITPKEMQDFREYYLLNRIPNAGKTEINFVL